MNQRTMMTKVKATIYPDPVFGHWDILLGIYWPMASSRNFLLVHSISTQTSPSKGPKRNESWIPQNKANKQAMAEP